MMTQATPKSFKLALLQLGGLSDDKTRNLKIAADQVKKAVSEGKADMVVLPVSLVRSPHFFVTY